MSRHLKTRSNKARKTHRKSRHGCANCKRRRIKCDEQKPACSNCINRSIQCIFVSAAPPFHLAGPPPNHSAPAPFSHSPNPSSSSATQDTALDIPALSLLHHWTLHTSATISQDPDTQSCWRTAIPRLGFGFPFVLDGLLALSALHLAHLHPTPHHHAATSAAYWESALRGASAALAAPPVCDPDAIPALYAFAVTSCFYMLARGPQRGGDLLVCCIGEDGAAAADWLILFRGVRSLVEMAKEQVLDGPLAPLSTLARRQLARCSRSRRRELQAQKQQRGQGGEGEGEEEEGGGGAGSAALRELLHAIDDAGDDEEPNGRTYAAAADSLAFCFEVVELEGKRGGDGVLAAGFQAFFWLYRVEDDFVLCLQQQRPMALVIYAHFVVLLKTMDWSWIIGDWPNHLMAQIYEAVDESWRVRLRWPIEQVGWQP